MQTIQYSEARSRFKSVLDQVTNDATYAVITRQHGDAAVLMSLDTFNSLMETVHLLKSPANLAHLATSIEQYRRGQLVHRDLADAD